MKEENEEMREMIARGIELNWIDHEEIMTRVYEKCMMCLRLALATVSENENEGERRDNEAKLWVPT